MIGVRRSSSSPSGVEHTMGRAFTVVTLLLAICAHLSNAQPVAETEKPALQAIMGAWGAVIPLSDTWFVASDCSQWLGLTCDAIGRVVSLDISGQRQLSGSPIPDAIAQLTSLQKLNLRRNMLAGIIPPTIGYLSSLTNLTLSGNSLEGSLPATISSLVKLVVMDVSSNSLSGPLPDSFAPLTLINTLAVGSNKFSGSLPPSLLALSSLQTLLLGGNEFTGLLPPAITGLQALVALDVSHNNFHGPLPADLGNLPALVFLDLSANQFTGAPPSSFSSPLLASAPLATLDLSANFFSAPPPAFTAAGTAFCPDRLIGGHAARALALFPVSRRSGQRENCYLGGNWNLTESFTDARGRSNGRGGSASTSKTATAGVSTGAGCSVGAQRRGVECVAFCGAALPAGACGGVGVCWMEGQSKTPTCVCNSGYFVTAVTVQVGRVMVTYPTCSDTPASTPTPPPTVDEDTMWRRESRGAKLDGSALLSGSYYNAFFRYASLGFTGTASSPKWNVAPTVDWSARVPAALLGAKDQGFCSACWIFAPVSALESLYAIVYNVAPPNISEQKAIDCQGTWACEGGRPTDAFDYMAISGGLPLASSYSYTGIVNPTLCQLSLRFRARRLLTSDRTDSESSPFTSSPHPFIDGSDPSSASASSMTAAAHSRSLLGMFRASAAHSRSLLGMFRASAAAPPPSLPPSPFSLSMFESVGISGWLGLALAVQKQPVVVYISARAESFRKYTGSTVYSDPSCFSEGIIDHLVLVVGFNLLHATPFWIIRNSWGSAWGDSGYMRIALTGGAGVCGMLSMPGLYPVIKTPDPCKPINPCGGGTCSPVKNNRNQLNKCSCPTNFMAVTNLDKTQTCAVAKVCSFFAFNPCGFGTCIDDSRGGYSCLCSQGYTLGQRADGERTCVPAPSDAITTRVTLPVTMSCGQVRSTYQLSKREFQTLNPRLKCSGTFPAGTVVTVRNATAANATVGCVTPYTIAQGDTCASISSSLNITQATLAATNPDIECGALTPGMQLCLSTGIPQSLQCTSYYSVNPGESCADVSINSYPPITAAELFQLNPGLICTADSAQRLVGQEVCVDAAVVGACASGSYKVIRGDTCASLACRLYGCSTAKMSRCNGGWVCTSSSLYVGRVLCRC